MRILTIGKAWLRLMPPQRSGSASSRRDLGPSSRSYSEARIPPSSAMLAVWARGGLASALENTGDDRPLAHAGVFPGLIGGSADEDWLGHKRQQGCVSQGILVQHGRPVDHHRLARPLGSAAAPELLAPSHPTRPEILSCGWRRRTMPIRMRWPPPRWCGGEPCGAYGAAE
jgi:hypothetical protein